MNKENSINKELIKLLKTNQLNLEQLQDLVSTTSTELSDISVVSDNFAKIVTDFERSGNMSEDMLKVVENYTQNNVIDNDSLTTILKQLKQNGKLEDGDNKQLLKELKAELSKIEETKAQLYEVQNKTTNSKYMDEESKSILKEILPYIMGNKDLSDIVSNKAQSKENENKILIKTLSSLQNSLSSTTKLNLLEKRELQSEIDGVMEDYKKEGRLTSEMITKSTELIDRLQKKQVELEDPDKIKEILSTVTNNNTGESVNTSVINKMEQWIENNNLTENGQINKSFDEVALGKKSIDTFVKELSSTLGDEFKDSISELNKTIEEQFQKSSVIQSTFYKEFDKWSETLSETDKKKFEELTKAYESEDITKKEFMAYMSKMTSETDTLSAMEKTLSEIDKNTDPASKKLTNADKILQEKQQDIMGEQLEQLQKMSSELNVKDNSHIMSGVLDSSNSIEDLSQNATERVLDNIFGEGNLIEKGMGWLFGGDDSDEGSSGRRHSRRHSRKGKHSRNRYSNSSHRKRGIIGNLLSKGKGLLGKVPGIGSLLGGATSVAEGGGIASSLAGGASEMLGIGSGVGEAAAGVASGVGSMLGSAATFLATNPVGWAIAGGAAAAAIGTGIYHLMIDDDSEEVENRLEDSGAIDHSYFGESTIKDWSQIASLSTKDLDALIRYDDWSDEDKKAMESLKDLSVEERSFIADGLRNGNIYYNKGKFHLNGIAIDRMSKTEFWQKDQKTVEKVLDTDTIKELESKSKKADKDKKKEDKKPVEKENSDSKNTDIDTKQDGNKVEQKPGKDIKPDDALKGSGKENSIKDTALGALKTVAKFTPFGVALSFLKDSSDDKTIDELEKKGVIETNFFGNSEIKDWKAIAELKSEQIQDLIKYDDWSESDENHLKEILQIQKSETDKSNINDDSIKVIDTNKISNDITEKQNDISEVTEGVLGKEVTSNEGIDKTSETDKTDNSPISALKGISSTIGSLALGSIIGNSLSSNDNNSQTGGVSSIGDTTSNMFNPLSSISNLIPGFAGSGTENNNIKNNNTSGTTSIIKDTMSNTFNPLEGNSENNGGGGITSIIGDTAKFMLNPVSSVASLFSGNTENNNNEGSNSENNKVLSLIEQGLEDPALLSALTGSPMEQIENLLSGKSGSNDNRVGTTSIVGGISSMSDVLFSSDNSNSKENVAPVIIKGGEQSMGGGSSDTPTQRIADKSLMVMSFIV